MNNLLSYCGFTDARVRASEKDLPVPNKLQTLGKLKEGRQAGREIAKKFPSRMCGVFRVMVTHQKSEQKLD